eukprot:s2939_g12.t1
MLRAVATCKHLQGTLAKQLKAAVRFQKAEWVILGEIEAANFNNRVGQIVGAKPENSCRCAVEVDGLRQNQEISWLFHSTTQKLSRMVGLSRFKLYAFRLSNRDMLAAVRIHARRDLVSGPLREKYVQVKNFDGWPSFISETRVPRELAIFADQQGQGQCPLMTDLGRPIVFHQVVPLSNLDDIPNVSKCLSFFLLVM